MIADLFIAARAGNLPKVRELLDANPHLIDIRNSNALGDNQDEWDEVNLIHSAAKFGHLDVIHYLVRMGAQVYSNPLTTYPAVAVAAWEKHDEIVRYFLNEIPDKAEGTGGIGIICNLAGRLGWMKQVQMHIDRDPLAVHQRGWIGDTPLHWPAHNGFIEIVKLLLENGADPNAQVLNWMGGTPLHWASERNPTIVEMLIRAGADVNARVTLGGSSMLGATPLIWCAKQRDDCADAVAMLLTHGADKTVLDS